MGIRYWYKRTRAFLSKPRLQIQEKSVILSDRDICLNPIFIVGIHRSGTSLTRRIINSHSQIACPPETFFLRHFVEMLNDPYTAAGMTGFGYSSDEVAPQLAIMAGRFHEAFRIGQGKARWADKTPHYVEILGGLHKLFSESAQFIVIRRHPYDIAHSLIRRGWSFNQYSENPVENVALYVRDMWERIDEFVSRHPEKCHTIVYEQMVKSPEKILKPMFSFLGAPWEDGVLDFHKAQHNFGTEDPQVAATKGFELSYGNWETLTKEQLDILDRHLGHLLDGKPYLRDAGQAPEA